MVVTLNQLVEQCWLAVTHLSSLVTKYSTTTQKSSEVFLQRTRKGVTHDSQKLELQKSKV